MKMAQTQKWLMFADRFENKKPSSQMSKLDCVIDFFVFLLVSLGYCIEVSYSAIRMIFFQRSLHVDDIMMSRHIIP